MTLEELEIQVTEALEDIDALMADDHEDILIDNKNIDAAMKQQIRLQIKWESVVSMIAGLLDECTTLSDELFAVAFHDRMINDDRSWSTTDAKILTQGDERYVKCKRLENRCKAAKREAEGFLRVIETRKYTLKNLTSLIIAGSDKYIL